MLVYINNFLIISGSNPALRTFWDFEIEIFLNFGFCAEICSLDPELGKLCKDYGFINKIVDK